LANRKAAREEEIQAHGKPITFQSRLYRSKKIYNRKHAKQTIICIDDGFYVMPISPEKRPQNILSMLHLPSFISIIPEPDSKARTECHSPAGLFNATTCRLSPAACRAATYSEIISSSNRYFNVAGPVLPGRW
jgi:hypothetical protein